MVRYHNTNFEVYDGNMWIPLYDSSVSISLDVSAIEAVDWARKKMDEEQRLKNLAETHPAIKNAYDNFKKAAEHLQTTIILSQDEQTTS